LRKDMTLMNPLKDKVALVTGAGQGLGAAICRSLSEAGVVVALGDIKPDGLKKTAAGLTEAGCEAQTYVLDVGDRESVERVIDNVIKDCGRLEFVINNAGVDYTKPIEEMTFEEWDRVINVNLRGPFVVSKTVFPHLRSRGG